MNLPQLDWALAKVTAVIVVGAGAAGLETGSDQARQRELLDLDVLAQRERLPALADFLQVLESSGRELVELRL